MSVNVSLTIRIKVKTESHPAAEVSVTLWEPAAVNVKPFQTSGNCAEQMVESIELLICGFILKLSVTTESHPAAEINVALCEPAAANVSPFQTYGSCASQMVRLVLDETAGRMVRSSITTESQPAADPPAMVNVAVLLLAL